MSIPDVHDVRWLLSNSPFVFVGHLTSQTPRTEGGSIVTAHEFQIESVIVGDETQRSLTLTTLGGELDGQVMRVSHTPRLATKGRYVVFTGLGRTQFDPITGNAAGVFRIVDSLVYNHDGYAVFAIDNGALKFGEPTPGRAAPPNNVPDPSVSGGVIATERAASEPSRAMTVDAFAAAILALAQTQAPAP